MGLPELIDRVPALARLEGALAVFMPRHSVQMAVQGDTLILSWIKNGERQWRRAVLPQDMCRDGLPMQRQALGELCADLLLDSGLPLSTVDLDLHLPLEACVWRLLEGEGDLAHLDAAKLRQEQAQLDWPLTLQDAYLSLMPVPGHPSAQLVVGVQRLMLQAWMDVVEAADISLHRVDWSLAAAWRGLIGSFDEVPADLVWLIRELRSWRVVLLTHGLPQIDRVIKDVELDGGSSKPEALRIALEQTLASWDKRQSLTDDLNWQRYWWITARLEDHEQWLEWMARVIHGPMLGLPKEDLSEGDAHLIDPLVALGLRGGEGLDLLEERRSELGLKAATPQVYGSRSLLLQGAGWGGGVLLLGLLGWGSMVWLEGMQAQQLEALLPVEQLVVDTEASLRRLKARTASLEKDNKQIAQQLVAVRSGSALLEQLRQITPEGVQLEELSVTGDTIKLRGGVEEVRNPEALERINALVLALTALPETKAEGVKVVKILSAGTNNSAAMSFSLTWALDPAAKPSLQQLERLGAEGMAERLRLLQRQGVSL